MLCRSLTQTAEAIAVRVCIPSAMFRPRLFAVLQIQKLRTAANGDSCQFNWTCLFGIS